MRAWHYAHAEQGGARQSPWKGSAHEWQDRSIFTVGCSQHKLLSVGAPNSSATQKRCFVLLVSCVDMTIDHPNPADTVDRLAEYGNHRFSVFNEQ
jgi:hypothetical protein